MNGRVIASELRRIANNLVKAGKSTISRSTVEDIEMEGDCSVYEDYSGRGMFGRTCIGFSGNSSTSIIEVCACNGLRGAKTDSLGRDYIVYFPNIISIED